LRASEAQLPIFVVAPAPKAPILRDCAAVLLAEVHIRERGDRLALTDRARVGEAFAKLTEASAHAAARIVVTGSTRRSIPTPGATRARTTDATVSAG
jgi:hypothetical protein